jgi:hypothetical protein
MIVGILADVGHATAEASGLKPSRWLARPSVLSHNGRTVRNGLLDMSFATEDEAIEAWMKQELETHDVSPSRYYPVTAATKQACAARQRKPRRRTR